MRCALLALLALAVASAAAAQGNVGITSFERQWLSRLPDSTRTHVVRNRTEGVQGAAADSLKNRSDLLGEANIALGGKSLVKPAAMATVAFRMKDYLLLYSQLMSGADGNDVGRAEVAQRMFVPEASTYALTAGVLWRPGFGRKDRSREVAFNAGFYYAQKGLPPDSSEAGRDTGVIHLHGGIEYMPVYAQMSVYVNANWLAMRQNVSDYRSFFGTEVDDSFLYVSPGLRVQFSDELFVDLEMAVVNDKMKALAGNQDGILPLFRLGFSQGLKELR